MELSLYFCRYWNEFYGRFDTYDFGFGQEAFQEKSCAFSNCFTTKDRNLLPMEEYDAIIIHIRGLPNDWPKTRSVNQVKLKNCIRLTINFLKI